MSECRLEWSSAEVKGGRLVVELAGEPSKDWKKSFEAVVQRLDRGSSAWGEIELGRDHVRVADVRPGAEDDVRHFLESAVQQANADTAPPGEAQESDADSERDKDEQDPDRQMTEAFRSFGSSPDED